MQTFKILKNTKAILKLIILILLYDFIYKYKYKNINFKKNLIILYFNVKIIF